jgi:hypothetical protein
VRGLGRGSPTDAVMPFNGKLSQSMSATSDIKRKPIHNE